MSFFITLPADWYIFKGNFVLHGAALILITYMLSVVLRDLHDKYGPIVRVGPNEVSLSNPKMYRDIYTARSVVKDPKFYRPFEFIGQNNVFATTDQIDHAARKKILSPPFSYRNIIDRSDVILDRTDVMIDRILRRAYASPSRTADVYEPLGIWSVEVICKLMFNCDMSPDEHEFSTMLKAMEGSPPTFFIDIVFPWLRRLKLETSLPGPIGHAYRSCAQWHKETARLLPDFQKRNLSTEEKLGFLGGHVFSTPHKVLGRTLTFNEAVGEAMGIALAGSSVAQHTLSYLLYELARPEGQNIQERLRREIQDVGGEVSGLMDLPYLDAVIKETHRVHPAIMSTLPRILTQPLVVQDTDITLPPGTIVGMQNFVHHRDSVLFPQPDSFVPERWLEGHALNEGVTLKDMDAALTPYSLGTRACLGQTLAKIQLPLSVARFLKRVKFTLSNEMTEDDMFAQDLWAVNIKGGKLLLRIQVLEKEQ